MATMISRARWLEPVGQACVIAAFGLQYFYVEPASTAASKALFNEQFEAVKRIEQRIAGKYKPRFPQEFLEYQMPYVSRTSAEQLRDHLKPYYGWLFLFGGVLTVLGKMASVRASTK